MSNSFSTRTGQALRWLIVCLLVDTAWAGGPGTTGGIGLKLPAGARPTAMGSAFVGKADDLNAVHWNPAGLALVRSPELSLMHSRYLVDTNYQVLAYAHPLPALGTVAVSFNMLDYGDLPRTRERPDGLYGGIVGNTSPQDMFLTAGLGRHLPFWGMANLKVGVSLKVALEELTSGTMVGVGGSVGGLYDIPGTGLRVGTVFDNLGALTRGGKTLPMNWVVGASYGTDIAKGFRTTYVVDGRLSVDTSAQANLGAEISAFNILAVRGGWRGGGALGGPSFGVGVLYPLKWLGSTTRFKLDYSMAMSGELGRSQRFQLGKRFGFPGLKPKVGDVRMKRRDGKIILTWKGNAPAYHVFMKLDKDGDFKRITKRPLKRTDCKLLGLWVGRYVFRVVGVDPLQPDWRGPVSEDYKVRVSKKGAVKKTGKGSKGAKGKKRASKKPTSSSRKKAEKKGARTK